MEATCSSPLMSRDNSFSSSVKPFPKLVKSCSTSFSACTPAPVPPTPCRNHLPHLRHTPVARLQRGQKVNSALRESAHICISADCNASFRYIPVETCPPHPTPPQPQDLQSG